MGQLINRDKAVTNDGEIVTIHKYLTKTEKEKFLYGLLFGERGNKLFDSEEERDQWIKEM